MNEPISTATIALIKALGFRVFMRSPRDTWLYFTSADGKRIGYLQNDYFGGYTLSSVHKANQQTGTGFQIHRMLSTVDKQQLEDCFVHAPGWASRSDSRTVVKYRDIDEMIARDAFSREYREA
jgi:hypothetical protein